MATSVDMGGDTLYVNDIFVGNSTPGSLSGNSVTTGIGAQVTPGVNVTAATVAPTASQTGTTFVLSRAAGVTVTLPATAPVGTWYSFIVGVVATSNQHKVITGTPASQFLSGGIYFDKALTITRYDGDNSTNVSVKLNGTTTGGATIGDEIIFTCVSSTSWTVSGTVTASGTLATPFATS